MSPNESENAVSSNRVLRIATRKSPLAMWQAEHVANLLAKGGIGTTIVPLVSTGDVDMRPIDGTRQVGLFTKRIQEAVIDNDADIAVHSMKDLPTEAIPDLLLAAIPERETVADCLVSPSAWTIEQLPKGAKIGTGSKRRAAQLLFQRNDLDIQPIRGNVQTRIEKLNSGEYDAIILANAGLLRLKMSDLSRTELSLQEMLPAPGQGALGIEVRSDDSEAFELLQSINDLAAWSAVNAERTVLSNLNGGCLAPIAAYAECTNEEFRITARVLSPDGKEQLEETITEPRDMDGVNDSHQHGLYLGHNMADLLERAGAKELIAQAR